MFSVFSDLFGGELFNAYKFVVGSGSPYEFYRFVVTLLLLSTPALSQGTRVFYTYSEWERMSDNQRSLYIAGAIDALLMYASNIDRPNLAVHLYNCLTKTNLNNLQLANNVQAYTRQHPAVQGDTVQMPLILYLRALCGPVPR
jgi:hypothetical protein